MYSPDTSFCGYSVPHPSEDLMNVRVQTISKYYLINKYNLDTPSDKVVSKGLVRVSKICDILTEKFQLALSNMK
jgi:DNA-directed RNA polymerase I and III subunit RPAC2